LKFQIDVQKRQQTALDAKETSNDDERKQHESQIVILTTDESFYHSTCGNISIDEENEQDAAENVGRPAEAEDSLKRKGWEAGVKAPDTNDTDWDVCDKDYDKNTDDDDNEVGSKEPLDEDNDDESKAQRNFYLSLLSIERYIGIRQHGIYLQSYIRMLLSFFNQRR
jgi:hypothetical protein